MSTESAVKHTTGKWYVIEKLACFDTPVIVSDQIEDAVICSLGGDIVEMEANARLIAAAPDLLETVIAYRLHHKLMLQIADDVDCPCKICKMAEDVIRQAKGE